MVDEFSERYADLLTGSYDCVDRIVLNAYYPRGHNPGGFRVWWRRWHQESDEQLDNAHLMRLAGRFARRVRAWAEAHQVPVIDCKAEERKHRIAEEYLREHTVGVGVFLILVARAPTTVWKVSRTRAGVIRNLDKTRQFVNHYSFHIVDPSFGHDQDERAPAVRGAGDPQRPRVRRLPGTGGRPRLREGGQLLHPHR